LVSCCISLSKNDPRNHTKRARNNVSCDFVDCLTSHEDFKLGRHPVLKAKGLSFAQKHYHRLTLEISGRSLQADDPVAFRHLENAYKTRNSVVHNGELSYRDPSGAKVLVTRSTANDFFRGCERAIDGSEIFLERLGYFQFVRCGGLRSPSRSGYCLSTKLPSSRATVLMKHRDDCSGFRVVYEINGIWKLVKQGAAHIFIDDWKPKRVISDVLK
jgi:hypothetical protein